VAYRADIEIAVKGAQELKRLQDQVRATSKLVDGLNNYLQNIGGGGTVRSINNLNKSVADTAAAFNKVALGTDEATLAARNFVAANRQLTQGLEERLALVKSITEQERRQRLGSAGIRETTQYGGPIGPGPASSVGSLVGQKSPVAEKINRILQAKKDEVELQAGLLRLEQKSAAVLNEKLELQQKLNRAALEQGKKDVETVSLQQAQRQQFLAGKSAAATQGPLAGPGAMGFPVALSLTKVEQRALEIAAKKQEILQRMATTKQALVGLAANLQRLELNSTVAIADAVRNQDQLNAAKARQLAITQQIRVSEAAASSAARQRLAEETARRNKIQNAGFGVQGPAVPPQKGAKRGGGGGRLGGAISGSIIGGAFPLLFGQGAGAAAGGAAGGLIGGLFGPGGSFAGSLLGTLIGDIASKGNVVKKLGEDIGFSAQQTKTLETAFKQAGGEFDKFQASVQNIRGLSLEIEDQANAIRLVSTLTEKYGGEIDKTTNAYTSAIEAGKVTQATLNQLTNQGIPIQQALADKYKVSRSELLQMAKDGKISVQDLSDTLVDLGNKGVSTTEKTKTGFDNLVAATNNVGTALSRLGGIIVSSLQGPLDWLSNRLASIVDAAARGISRINDLLAGGKQAQANIQASAGAQTLTRNKFGARAANPFDKEVQAFRTAQEKDIYRRLTGTKLGPDSSEARPPLQKITIPGQLPPSGGGGGGKSAADKAARDAQRAAEEKQRLDALLKQLQEEIRIRTETIGLEKSLVEARADQNDQLEAQIQSSIRLLDIGSKQAVVQKNFEAGKIGRAEYTLRLQLLELDRTEDQIKYEEDLNRIFKERYGITDAIARLARESRAAAFGGTGATGTFRTDLNLMPGLTEGTLGEEYDAVKLQLDELLKVENQVISAADTIGQAFGNSFKGVIDGSLSAREALAGFFSSVADSFADMVAQLISEWIKLQIIGLAQSLLPGGSTVFPQGVGNFSGAFGSASSVSFNPGAAFGGFRASGGSVNSGSSYMVGERGPELFVPGRSGTIVPNDKMGGGTTNVVVNVDAKGSSVEGNEQGANQLGRVISAAVQSELIKQKRPGGLLAR